MDEPCGKVVGKWMEMLLRVLFALIRSICVEKILKVVIESDVKNLQSYPQQFCIVVQMP